MQTVVLVCLGILVFLENFVPGYSQNPCSSTGSRPTECISLTKCVPLLNLVRESGNLKADQLETLRNSQCGSEGNTPRVCCPIAIPETATQSASRKPAMVPESGVIPDPPDVTNHTNLRLINNANCGPATEDRIIQGNKAKVLQYPWMALIGYNISGQNVTLFACGGTLISKRYVLTAAHCVVELGSRTKLSLVRLGEHDLSMEMDCQDDLGGLICADKVQEFSIESLNVHADYNKREHSNDIALIRIDRDADLKPLNVGTICLPVGQASTFRPKKALVTGWGLTEIGIRSQVLLRASLDLVPNDDCTRVYSERNNVTITYNQLCAGGKDGRDSCTGDSGGPLQAPTNIDGLPKYVQYGIISFGPARCGVIGHPGVYVSVPYFMDWILDTMVE